jgi:serine/threonine protein kinase
VTEVNVLGVVEHPNLVKLIGYCAEDDERGIQRLLVYEYVQNRSVQDHLSNRFIVTPLPWSTRLKIAQDTARGLAYLHQGMEFQVSSPSMITNAFKPFSYVLETILILYADHL